MSRTELSIPADLRALPRWVVWRTETRDGKPTKVPYCANGRTDGKAASDDPATWTTFEQASSWLELYSERFDGLGFVFAAEDPFAGFDADDCLDPATGELHPEAARMVAMFPGAYVERSPSGTGVKLWTRARKPGARCRTSRTPWSGEAELYDSLRYFAVTGDALGAIPDEIADGQKAYEELYAELFDQVSELGANAGGRSSPSPDERGSKPGSESSLLARAATGDGFQGTDAELVELAKSFRNGERFAALWNGDTTGYPSPSEADAALCSMLAFVVGPDGHERVSRLFLESELGQREKARRPDYVSSTVELAFRHRTDFYSGPSSAPEPPRPNGGSPSGRSFGLSPLSEIEERPIRYFEKPLWLADSFSLFVARSGAGKGVTLADLASRTTRGELGARRSVVWFASEDSAATDLRPRLAVAGADLGRVHVIRPGSGWLRLPEDIELVRSSVEEIGDVALVIIDPVASYLGKQGQTTTDEVHVRNALDPLNALADELAVVVVGVRHITEKGRDGDLASLILGTSAWVQVPRAVVGIVKDNEDPDVRHIGVAAGNRVREGDVLSLRIVGVDRSEKGHETEIPRVQWLGESAKSLDDLLRGSGARSKSGIAREAFLEELRAAPDHELPSDELDRRVMERTGIAEKTARNVRSGLREAGLVGARRDGFGASGTWFAYLTTDGESA